MSYASGMAIGLTIGQQLLKFFSKDGGTHYAIIWIRKNYKVKMYYEKEEIR